MMKVAKIFLSLEKLYEKRAALDKQIADIEKKIIIDLERKLMAEVKSATKPAPSAVKKSTAKKSSSKNAPKPNKVK